MRISEKELNYKRKFGKPKKEMISWETGKGGTKGGGPMASRAAQAAADKTPLIGDKKRHPKTLASIVKEAKKRARKKPYPR